MRPKSADPVGSAGRKALRRKPAAAEPCAGPGAAAPRTTCCAVVAAAADGTLTAPHALLAATSCTRHTAPHRTTPHCIVARGVYPAQSTHPSTPVWVGRDSARHSAHSPAASCELLLMAADGCCPQDAHCGIAKSPRAHARGVGFGGGVGVRVPVQPASSDPSTRASSWACACQCSLRRAIRAHVQLPAHTPPRLAECFRRRSSRGGRSLLRPDHSRHLGSQQTPTATLRRYAAGWGGGEAGDCTTLLTTKTHSRPHPFHCRPCDRAM